MSAGEKRATIRQSVPVTAPFLLLLHEISCVCVVFKKCRFCHSNEAVQRRGAGHR